MSSVLHEDGGCTLTVTDEEGNTFILPLAPNGSVGVVLDSEGNIVVAMID